MIISATRSLLYRTFQETWHRGEHYANKDTVNILFQFDKMVTARVRGTQSYFVELEFKGNGLHRSCTCPVPDFCKHMVAVAIIWDELRGMPRPSDHDIATIAIPPPLVSTLDIRRAYDNPLHADLDVLRLASSDSGRWSRPHAQLPSKPTALRLAENEPITPKEVTKCCSEIRSWFNRSSYDLYFCAGEMVAATCEMMRVFDRRWNCTTRSDRKKIVPVLEGFVDELVMELIDDSDGGHIFLEAHLTLLDV